MKNCAIFFLILGVVILGLASPCQAANVLATTFVSVDPDTFPDISFRLRLVSPQPIPQESIHFEVMEDENNVASLGVTAENPRLRYILALDCSSDTGTELSMLARSAGIFIASMTADAEIGIISFADAVSLDHEFSSNQSSLINAVNSIEAGGTSALYDAIYKSCETFGPPADQSEIRTLIILTTGADGKSEKTVEQAIEMAQKSAVRIIMVAFGNSIDTPTMKNIVKETKGGFLNVPTPKELPEICKKINRKIQSEQYFKFNFRTPNSNRDGTIRQLKLMCSFEKDAGQGTTQYAAPSESSPSSENDPIPSDVAQDENQETAREGNTGAGTVPNFNPPTPKVNVHELKNKLNNLNINDSEDLMDE
ncbi:MAG: VWA domain-containing protein [Candidatus Riflebacteria bacterium]|nr:VWA domain-containing protein [Candidatus Riflebacteria bacterium]